MQGGSRIEGARKVTIKVQLTISVEEAKREIGGRRRVYMPVMGQLEKAGG